MPVSRLASESDIQGTDILTMATATLILTTDRTTMVTTVGRHLIGTAVTAFTTRGTIIGTIITGTGTKPKTPRDFEAGG
jgi:hypothetical protein